MKKMRLIPVVYFGFTAMDRRFSSPMLPWIFSEIRKREYQEKLSLGVEDGCLQAYNQDFEVQFAHKLSMMTRFSQADSDPNTFLYLLRDDVDQLLYCYLFATYKQSDVNELYQQMKDHHQAPKATPPSNNLTTLCVDISPSCSNFFEVLYIGKIKVWHKKVPDSFIDDALDKFKQHDLEKNRKKLARLKSEMDLRRGSIDSTCSLTDTSSTIANGMGVPRLQRSHSLLSNLSIKSPDVDRQLPTCIDRITEDNDQEEAETREPSASSLEKEKEELRKMSLEPPPPNLEADLEEELEKQLKKAANDEHNRTMVLQVDRTDLRLISPDRKVILLHKQHRDVTTCIQGSMNSQHFGFIAKETSNPGTVATYIGFVFRCESASVAAEAVAAITQAFTNPAGETSTPMASLGGATGRSGGQHRNSITSCDQCPMVWYHRLCCEIEALAERKQQAAIMRRIEQLDDDEQHLIMAKYRGAETDSLRERNEFLMMLLRAHCEMKQARHTHDTAEQRSEFLNQYLGGGNTIFMKAKRSLSNSFDHLLKRRGSRDDFAAVTREITKDLTLPVHSALSRESSPNATTSTTKDTTHDTLTVPEGDKEQLKSPMMDIFMKVGSNSTPPGAPSSWRQAIFKRVITPVQRPQGHKYTRDELRHLWKKSIHQAILLVRMEKENARIRAKQEESAVKRIKLEYDEMRLKNAEPYSEIWEIATLNKDDKSLRGKPDVKMLLQAIKLGIPRGKRGDVWHYLAEQYCAQLPPIDLQKFPTYGTPYETLLKQLTSHQHAILIDLGRTFPGHSYYASPLGPGQLALFNLLKAYSLLDPEVGYCQGLSFVAGVLLLHMDESSAFFLLTHLMYRRNLRQQYLPDMVGLQIKLYQLSRLLRDHLPAVYDHLDRYEVAPTLYAAPWLLTIFASQFPLGFVTRVFDLIFLENADAVFRVILALLTHHAPAILACDSFEDIMSLLKTKLPQIDAPALLDTIFRRVYALDLSKQLAVYAVEYNVLQEEMQSIQAQMETFHKTAARLRHAEEQQKLLTQQLDAALENVQRGEQTRVGQQQNIQRLETHNRSLEVTINTLGGYLHNLIETNPNLHIPAEVRRILGKIPEKPKEKHLFNLFNKQNPPMVKSLSTGRIATPPATATATTNDYNLRTHSFNINGNITSITSKKDVISPTNSTDSGVSTPTTHKDIIDESEEDSVNNNSEKKGPPLNHSDLTMTYNHRELKKVKSTRDMSRHSSPIVD